METKHVAMNKQQQEKLDQLLRGIAKERKVAIEADLETRLSYRDKDPKNPKAATWAAYSRFLLSDGHTVYVALRTMKASVSSKPDKFAIAKVERRLAKQKKVADRKAANAAKQLKADEKTITKILDSAEAKADPKPTTVKVKAKAKTKKMPVVKFNKDLSMLEGTSMRQAKK